MTHSDLELLQDLRNAMVPIGTLLTTHRPYKIRFEGDDHAYVSYSEMRDANITWDKVQRILGELQERLLSRQVTP